MNERRSDSAVFYQSNLDFYGFMSPLTVMNILIQMFFNGNVSIFHENCVNIAKRAVTETFSNQEINSYAEYTAFSNKPNF